MGGVQNKLDVFTFCVHSSYALIDLTVSWRFSPVDPLKRKRPHDVQNRVDRPSIHSPMKP